jgi:hypothetical protein
MTFLIFTIQKQYNNLIEFRENGNKICKIIHQLFMKNKVG